MDDAGELSALLGLDWNHVPAVAQRDDRLLYRRSRGVKELVEARGEPVVRDARFSAQLREHWRGSIHHLRALVDAAPDLRGDLAEVPDVV